MSKEELQRKTEKMLGPDKHILFLGAGPANLATGLELIRQMGKNAPKMTYVDRRNYPNDQDDWEPCKGCAARWLNESADDVAQRYDPEREIFRVTGDNITVASAEGERVLAPNVLTHVALHIPGQIGNVYAVAPLAPPEYGYMTYRHDGPRAVWLQNGRQEIGLHHALWLLLEKNMNQANPEDAERIKFVNGKVRQVDLKEKNPKVTVNTGGEEDVELSADLVISGMGVTGNQIPILSNKFDTDSRPRMPDVIGAAVREVVISPALAGRIYGTDLNMCHMFILPPSGAGKQVQYAMLLPQWVTYPQTGQTLPVITVSMIGREGVRYESRANFYRQFDLVVKSLGAYLPKPGPDENIRDVVFPSCRCQPSIPVSSLLVNQTYDDGWIAIGDQTGALRQKKNGIGTGIRSGQKAAEKLITLGFGREALALVAQDTNAMYYDDNLLGKNLLDWLDTLVIRNPILSRVVYAFTLIEQYFPDNLQVIIKTMKDLTTGSKSYEQITSELLSLNRGGNIYTRGVSTIIRLIAYIYNQPPPKV